jgi:hypothetical protein
MYKTRVASFSTSIDYNLSWVAGIINRPKPFLFEDDISIFFFLLYFLHLSVRNLVIVPHRARLPSKRK